MDLLWLLTHPRGGALCARHDWGARLAASSLGQPARRRERRVLVLQPRRGARVSSLAQFELASSSPECDTEERVQLHGYFAVYETL